MLVKIANKDSETVVNALIKQACKLPEELFKSLTWDRGSEMTEHKRFTVATTSKSASVILATLGNAVRTRTRTGS